MLSLSRHFPPHMHLLSFIPFICISKAGFRHYDAIKTTEEQGQAENLSRYKTSLGPNTQQFW